MLQVSRPLLFWRSSVSQKIVLGPYARVGNQWRVRLQIEQTESITGTSTSTPTTQTSAAPDSGPNRVIATATASSKKLLAPISAPGAATL